VLTLMVGGKWGVVRFFVGILLFRGVFIQSCLGNALIGCIGGKVFPGEESARGMGVVCGDGGGSFVGCGSCWMWNFFPVVGMRGEH